AHAARFDRAARTEDISNVELISEVEVDSSVDLTSDVEMLPDDAVISGEIGHEDPTRYGLNLEPRHMVVRSARNAAPTPAVIVGLPSRSGDTGASRAAPSRPTNGHVRASGNGQARANGNG